MKVSVKQGREAGRVGNAPGNPFVQRVGRYVRSIFCLFILALPSGTALAQQPLFARGPFLAQAAGVTFLEKAGTFQRVDILTYSRDGKNLSVGYNSTEPTNPILATIYIYPAGRVLSFGSPRDVVNEAHDRVEQMEMDSVVHEILSAHRGAQIVRQERGNVAWGGRSLAALHARFSYAEPFFGKRQRLLGDIWLSTVGKWYVKYRVTYPAANASSAMTSVQRLMKKLPIPAA